MRIRCVLGSGLLVLGLFGCETASRFDDDDDHDHDHGHADSGMVDDGDAGTADGGDAEVAFGGLTPNAKPEDRPFDLFAKPGHRFWFEVSKEQLEHMNGRGGSGGGVFFGGGGGDIYSPDAGKTFASPVLLQEVASGDVIDFGKVQVRLVGNETFRVWDEAHIPNLRIDADEFVKLQRIGSFEHFRLNNSLTGTIFREHMAHEIFRAVGYPALRSSYAWVGSSVWGPDAWVPMTLIEVYKRRFCQDNEATLGSTCTNMWEFGQALTQPLPPDACQVSACDDTQLETLGAALRGLPRGPGFMKKLDKLIDWKRFHEFQCLSWMIGSPDDPIHADNNHVIAERDSDHRLIWLPYSVDISQASDWGSPISLTGTTAIPRGCQADPECWQETIATCDTLIDKLEAANPRQMLAGTVAQLDALGMLRDGDQERAEALDAWYETRQKTLRADLAYYSHLPDPSGACPDGMVRCEDGVCAKQAQCDARRCSLEKPWCPSRHACVSRKYDQCPSCAKANPYWCGVSGECVADDFTCNAECIATAGEGSSYCSFLGSCVQDGQCFDDGGGFPGGPGGPIID